MKPKFFLTTPSFAQVPLLGLIFVPFGALSAATINSTASGTWNASGTWSGGTVPQTGVSDTANILTGHTVIYTSSAPFAGLNGSNDFGVGNGNTININGGVLSQAMDGWWMRIGHKAQGTLNINEGRVHVTDGTGGGTNFQVGVETNGNGVVNIGDDTGAEFSAVLNLRDRVDGSANGGSFDMNLAGSNSSAGHVAIFSDGVLEGDQKTWSNGNPVQNPHIRIGQGSSGNQSDLTVHAGGHFNARGNVEVGAQGGASGYLHLDGLFARMDMSDGELTIGYTGTGMMTVENDAVFSRTNTNDARSDLFVGRSTSGNGTINISFAQFLRQSGGNIGDMRIGYDGTGVLNVGDNGLYHNESGNWDWLGQNASGNGTVNVNGGTYEITSGSNLIIGLNGTGTFHHNSGSTNVSGIRAGVNSGTGLITVDGGTFNVRAGLYLGGDSTASAGTGSATLNQSGGLTSVAGALVIGIAANHTGTYNLNGGSLTHSSSDISVGESGTGSLTIASGASLTDSSTTAGQFLVGRNEGSSGTLIVNGSLSKSGGTSAIRVGNGDTNGVDNTTAPGVLGGSGSISSSNGVRIGSHGTITGGLTSTVGTLSITGNLSFSALGIYRANVAAGSADRLTVSGDLDVTNAKLQFDVLSAPTTSEYVLASYTGNLAGTFTVLSLPVGYEVKYDTAAKQIKLVKPGFSGWASAHGLSGSAAADFDHDGLSDAVEYVLGTNPNSPNPGGPAVSPSGGNFVVSFNRDHASITSDVSVDIVVSDTLASWPTAYHVGPTGGSSSPQVTVTDQGTYDTVTLTLARGADVKKFARLRATVTP